MTRRTIIPLVVLAALVLSATSAGAKTPRIVLRLPSPGHVTVAALRMTVTADKPAALPRRMSLGAPKLGELPPAVKVLFATRSAPLRRGRRYMAIVFVVRKAGGAPLAYGAGLPHEPNMVDLIFAGGSGSWSVCKGCGHERPRSDLQEDLCTDCGAARATSQLFAIKNADKARPGRLSVLNDLFRSDWTRNGDPEPVFGGPGGQPDPTLETGHYDDGHSFGWGTPPRPTLPPPDVLRVEIDLVEDLIERQPAQLVPDLELATAVDLNGDGAIGPTQQIDTRVGPIVIT